MCRQGISREAEKYDEGRSRPRLPRGLRRIQPDRLSTRQTNFLISLRHGRADRGCLDLVPELRVGGGLYLEPMVVCALPGADHFSQIVHYDVALCRYNDKNEMPNSRGCLDHRQPQGFRGQAVLKKLVPRRDSEGKIARAEMEPRLATLQQSVSASSNPAEACCARRRCPRRVRQQTSPSISTESVAP